MPTYAGKTIIVTGASSGIGRALVLALAPQRARLVLSGRDEARLEQTAEACRAAGAEALAVRADVAVPGQCQTLVARTMERFGQVGEVPPRRDEAFHVHEIAARQRGARHREILERAHVASPWKR